MTTNFVTNTASLKTTVADVRKLNAKKIFVEGENILDIIKDATPTIKHSQDTRETVTENDLWGQWVETLEDGTIIVHDDEVVNPNGGTNAWNTSITKVEDNKAYVGEDLFANIQIEKIKDGRSFFYKDTALTSFVGNLDNLEIGGGSKSYDGMFNSCSNLTTFTSDLSSLENGGYMFGGCSKLTTFTSDLSSLTNGDSMFYMCTDLTTFDFDLSSLTNGTVMFGGCVDLTTFDFDLSSLTNGTGMFMGCKNLTTFNSDLSSLTNGMSMFMGCNNLTTFNSDLSSLTNGDTMFGSSNLTTFNSDLSSLTNGGTMFRFCKLTTFISDLSSLINGSKMFDSCSKLTTFTSDLSSLTNGSNMFGSCSKLTTFTSDLSSLTNGSNMFGKIKLSPQSVMYIVESIRNITEEKAKYPNAETGENSEIPWVTYDSETQKYSAPFGFMEDGQYVYTYNNPNPYTTTISSSDVGKLTIGINVTNDSSTIQQQLEDFAKEAYFDSWAELKQVFVDKGWTVTFQYGGTTTDITLSEDEKFRGIPVYARLIEVTPEGEEYTEEEKASAEYCTEDGTKYYDIDWGHDVTDYDQYQYFGSLLEACGYFGVIPKKYLEEA